MRRVLWPALIVLLCAGTASAQVARVFLAGTGSDTNDCTNQATPCRSLQGAVDQSPAGGEVIVLTSGGFGTANITKSITINAPDGVVAFNARTITVNIGATDKVTIRGLSMNGKVFGDSAGISFDGGGTLVIEHCSIGGFTNANVYMTAVSGHLVLKDCEITNSGFNGVQVTPSVSGSVATVSIENCRLANNHQSGFIIYDYVKAVVRNTASTNNFEGFAVLSIDLANAGSMVVDNCESSFNNTGLYTFGNGGTARLRVTNSSIFANANGMSAVVLGGGASSITTYGNNRVFNNFAAETFSGTATPF